MFKKILIIVIAVLVLGGGGTYYFLTKPPKDLSFNYDPGSYFVTDIKDSRRLLKTDIMIFASHDKQKEQWVEENHKIRDIIIFTLRAKTETDLTQADIEAKLNEEIIAKLNEEFETDAFVKIYFNEFVLQ
jgi:flagellar protein FliL